MKSKVVLLFLILLSFSTESHSKEIKVEKRVAGENLALVLSQGDKIYELYKYIPESARDPFLKSSPLFMGVIEKSGGKQKVIYFHGDAESFPSDLKISGGNIFLLIQSINGRNKKIIELKSNQEIYSGAMDGNSWAVFNCKLYMVLEDELFEIEDGMKKKITSLNPQVSVDKISANNEAVYISNGEGLFRVDISNGETVNVLNYVPSWFEAQEKGGVLFLDVNELKSWDHADGESLFYESDSEIWFIKRNDESLLIFSGDNKLVIISKDGITTGEIEQDNTFLNLRDALLSIDSVVFYYGETVASVVQSIRKRIRLYPREVDKDSIVGLFKEKKIGSEVILSIVNEDLNLKYFYKDINEEIIRDNLFALSLLEISGEEGFDVAKSIYLSIESLLSNSLRKVFIERLKKISPLKTEELIKKY